MPGVYLVLNLISGRIYIGSSKDVVRRIDHHRNALKKHKHANAHLQKSWNKYGQGSFVFQIIEECSIETRLQREQFWIDDLRPEYNILKKAGSGQGYKFSPEAAKKRGQARIANTLRKWGFSEPEIQYQLSRGISRARQARFSVIGSGNGRPGRAPGYTHGPQTRQKLSEINKGKRLSDDHKARISAGVKRFWDKCP